MTLPIMEQQVVPPDWQLTRGQEGVAYSFLPKDSGQILYFLEIEKQLPKPKKLLCQERRGKKVKERMKEEKEKKQEIHSRGSIHHIRPLPSVSINPPWESQPLSTP